MTEFNKYILVAMNHENHTQEELEAIADYAADYATTYIARGAAYASAAAFAVVYCSSAHVESCITRYFEITGEDKALYEAEIERINEANNE